MTAEYKLLHCTCDHGIKLSASIDDLAKAWALEAEKVWQKKGLPKLNKNITAAYAKHFSKAVEEGYGEKIGAIDYDTPDGNMLKHLVENVYAFSAAKNYTQLRQLTQALIGPDGKLRSYSQFKQAAFEINDTHVNQWLKAEYELAVAGSQMASKWADIVRSGATIVEFDVVMDSHTSDICRPLHGLRVKVTDPILNTYYPPNHFFCRTTVRLHHDGPVTPANKMDLPDIPPMFRVNLAKQKLIFPAGHSYWMGTPNEVIREAVDMAPINSWVPVENGTVLIHSKVDTEAKDFSEVMEVARDFAAKGKKVQVMPTLPDAADPLYQQLFKGAKANKCPDLLVNGKTFIEVKAPKATSSNNIRHAIAHASGQADHVVILLPEKMEWNTMKRIAKGKFNQHKALQVIEFKQAGAYYKFQNKNLLKQRGSP